MSNKINKLTLFVETAFLLVSSITCKETSEKLTCMKFFDDPEPGPVENTTCVAGAFKCIRIEGTGLVRKDGKKCELRFCFL